MNNKWIFAGVAALSLLAGAGLWLATQPRPGPVAPGAEVAPAALYAVTFHGLGGEPQSLGQFQGKVVVLNFWATWCAPCREEMPAFSKLQQAWASRGVQFVGVSGEDAQRVQPFAKSLGVAYPLWVGGDDAAELSRRLGNAAGVLPHTVLLDRSGNVIEARVGAYPDGVLEKRLAEISAK